MTRPPSKATETTETVVVTAQPAVQSTAQAVQGSVVGEVQQVSPDPATPDPHAVGPRPIGTLMVIAILLLVTLAFWMMVLGIQQGRA